MAWVTLVSDDGAATTDVQCETPMTTSEAREFADRIIAAADDLDA